MEKNNKSLLMLQSISFEEFQNFFTLIDKRFCQLNEQILSNQKKDVLLTREEVSKFFKCDLSTIHNWTKKGRLKSYGINGRVYYKYDEIQSALIALNSNNNSK